MNNIFSQLKSIGKNEKFRNSARYLILFFIAFRYCFDYFGEHHVLWDYSINAIIVIPFSIICLIILFSEFQIRIIRLFKYYLLFICASILTMFYTQEISVLYDIIRFIYIFIFSYAVLILFKNEYKKLFSAVSISLFLATLFALIQYYTGFGIYGVSHGSEIYKNMNVVTSFSIGGNGYGTYLVIFYPLIMALMLYNKRFIDLKYLLILLAIAITGQYTLSKTFLIITIFWVIIGFFKIANNNKKKFVMLGIAGVIFLPYIKLSPSKHSPVNLNMEKRFVTEVKAVKESKYNYLFTGRAELWGNFFKQYAKIPLTDKIFGIGKKHYNNFSYESPSNDIFGMAVEYGLIGLSFFLMYFISLFIRSWRMKTKIKRIEKLSVVANYIKIFPYFIVAQIMIFSVYQFFGGIGTTIYIFLMITIYELFLTKMSAGNGFQ